MILNALDLFCYAGGAGRGLADAGFNVIGVDIIDQPLYPYAFIQVDAISVKFLRNFDFIWASPPCQRYSVMTKRWGTDRKNTHPDLIEPVRKLLQDSKIPYCIENVVGAPLFNPVMLCGSMFGLQTKYGSQLRRHRLFECNFPVEQPKCRHNKGSVIGVYGGGAASRTKIPQRRQRRFDNVTQRLSRNNRCLWERGRYIKQRQSNTVWYSRPQRCYGYPVDAGQRIISSSSAGVFKVYRRTVFEAA